MSIVNKTVRGSLLSRFTVDGAGVMHDPPKMHAADFGRIWNGVLEGLERMASPQRQQAIDALEEELGKRGWSVSRLGSNSPHEQKSGATTQDAVTHNNDGRPGIQTTRADEAAMRATMSPMARNALANETARKFWENKSYTGEEK